MLCRFLNFVLIQRVKNFVREGDVGAVSRLRRALALLPNKSGCSALDQCFAPRCIGGLTADGRRGCRPLKRPVWGGVGVTGMDTFAPKTGELLGENP